MTIQGHEYEDIRYLSYVVKGAALLDERVFGWVKKIDLRKLDMCSLTDCLLGQLFGRYGDGKAHLGITQGADYGFDVFAGQGGDGVAYRQLRAAWFRVIAERAPATECPDCGRTFETRALHGLESGMFIHATTPGVICPESAFA